jgi:protein-tyrosine phosphatase
MIDLHCHFLPGIDDGPDTLDEALALARAAVADGITHSVLTSHVDPERYDNQRSNLAQAHADFAQQLAAAHMRWMSAWVAKPGCAPTCWTCWPPTRCRFWARWTAGAFCCWSCPTR